MSVRKKNITDEIDKLDGDVDYIVPVSTDRYESWSSCHSDVQTNRDQVDRLAANIFAKQSELITCAIRRCLGRDADLDAAWARLEYEDLGPGTIIYLDDRPIAGISGLDTRLEGNRYYIMWTFAHYCAESDPSNN